jgi:hypothetical protein
MRPGMSRMLTSGEVQQVLTAAGRTEPAEDCIGFTYADRATADEYADRNRRDFPVVGPVQLGGEWASVVVIL